MTSGGPPGRSLRFTVLSFRQLLEASALALRDLLVDPVEIGAVLHEKISLEEDSHQALFEAWLKACLALVTDQGILGKEFRIQALEEGPRFRVTVEVTGELVDPQRRIQRAYWKGPLTVRVLRWKEAGKISTEVEIDGLLPTQDFQAQ